MPANLPPEYYRKERELREAKDPEKKIDILNEMLAVMPKHKGTDKLQALLRAKIAKLKNEIRRSRKSKTRRCEYSIPKEGAGQVTLVGLPNSGKSSILRSLTNAEPKIGDYPFTTTRPEVGMIEFEDVRIQLVDLPPITPDTPNWIFGMIRNGDLSLLVVDLSVSEPKKSLKELLDVMKDRNIEFDGTHHAIVIGNKADIRKVSMSGITDLPIYYFSSLNPDYSLKRSIFEHLRMIRVYTKKPRKKFTPSEPLIMKRGSTVMDAANHLRKEFAQRLKYVRLWRTGMNGILVERSFILEDQDIIELHF